MAYNASTLKNLLDAGEIDRAAWREHFGDIGENQVPGCKDCLDRKNGTCSERSDPVECFLYGSHSQAGKVLLTHTRIL